MYFSDSDWHFVGIGSNVSSSNTTSYSDSSDRQEFYNDSKTSEVSCYVEWRWYFYRYVTLNHENESEKMQTTTETIVMKKDHLSKRKFVQGEKYNILIQIMNHESVSRLRLWTTDLGHDRKGLKACWSSYVSYCWIWYRSIIARSRRKIGREGQSITDRCNIRNVKSIYVKDRIKTCPFLI